MKYIKQAGVIFVFTLIGEIMKYLIPLPVPASIYGMMLLFFALLFGWIKLEDVKDTAAFMIEIMPIMFIPAGVGLINGWGVLKGMFWPVCLITVVTSITVMVATGLISQWIIRKGVKNNAE